MAIDLAIESPGRRLESVNSEKLDFETYLIRDRWYNCYTL